jgi:hypothetical protein
MTRRIFYFLFLLCLALPARAQEVSLPFDHSEWDQFLKKYVNEKGEVDYRAAQKDPTLLIAYLEKLKSFSASDFSKEWPREERMALLINAYNAGVVKSILDHYPLRTILDIPGGWDQSSVQIGKAPDKLEPVGKAESPSQAHWKEARNTRSLNEIENLFLRSGFRDEKILFVLCRGAKGSARLRQEAYVGPRLEGQLYLATREFVNDPTRHRIEPGEKKIVLSRLLQWYGRDFLMNWGNFPQEVKWEPQEMAVLSFLAHYLDDPKKVEFLREGKYKVK